MKLKYLLILLVAMFSCSDNEYYVSDNTVKPYLEKFKREAGKRGLLISWDGLVVSLMDAGNGLSRYDPNTHKIYIDTTDWTYKNMPEELFTHELGHAILKRHQHDFSKLPNGMAKSIMGNFSNRMISGWSADSIRYREKYYFDELFNPSTPVPSWSL
jgi:hypothetical protein